MALVDKSGTPGRPSPRPCGKGVWRWPENEPGRRRRAFRYKLILKEKVSQEEISFQSHGLKGNTDSQNPHLDAPWHLPLPCSPSKTITPTRWCSDFCIPFLEESPRGLTSQKRGLVLECSRALMVHVLWAPRPTWIHPPCLRLSYYLQNKIFGEEHKAFIVWILSTRPVSPTLASTGTLHSLCNELVWLLNKRRDE